MQVYSPGTHSLPWLQEDRADHFADETGRYRRVNRRSDASPGCRWVNRRVAGEGFDPPGPHARPMQCVGVIQDTGYSTNYLSDLRTRRNRDDTERPLLIFLRIQRVRQDV